LEKNLKLYNYCGRALLATVTAGTLAAAATLAPAAHADDLPLIDFSAANAPSRIAANPADSSAFTIGANGPAKSLNVTIAPGSAGYPGVAVAPAASAWDLSHYGEVTADITNTGTTALNITLRLDNSGDWHLSPWDMSNANIAPGQSGQVTVYFGYSFGNTGYALDSSKVVQALLCTSKPDSTLNFRVDDIQATGKPGDRPPGYIQSVKPDNGILVSPAHVVFPAAANATPQVTTFSVPTGQVWDLSDYNQVEFAIKNPGASPLHVYGRVDNAWATATDNSSVADTTIPAGASAKLLVPFAAAKPWDGSDKLSGCRLDSSHVVGVTLYTDSAGAGQSVDIIGVKASVAAQPIPSWLGKKPPTPGNWTLTLDQNFNSPTLDPKIWVAVDKPGASIWDSSSVEVAANAYIENGLLKLKTEKPAAMTFDDPTLNSRKYVTSMVTTYSKFTQKYGYFESKMKLPTGLGMWPAFWLMPDRGPKVADQWVRRDTKNGGMEFDILEYLARFGPYHYNIAMHWDGYQELHKSIGSERIYFTPDKDGFVTAGLLWGPGEVTFYANGQAVGHWKNDRISNVPEYIMYTQPVGGWGTNGIVDESKLPQYLQIKYVRVWQRADWKDIPDGPPLVPTPTAPDKQ
jgi:beta-glucanase (GH16 family)